MTIGELREILGNPYIDPRDEVCLDLGSAKIGISRAILGDSGLVLSARLDKDRKVAEAAAKYAVEAGPKEEAAQNIKSFITGVSWAFGEDIK